MSLVRAGLISERATPAPQPPPIAGGVGLYSVLLGTTVLLGGLVAQWP